MSIPLSFGTNNVTVYSYEPFSYRLSNNIGGTTKLVLASRTSGIPPSYLTVDDVSATFSTSNNAMIPGNQQFVINLTNASGTVISNTSTTSVTIGPGRFLDGSGNSFVGSNYTFYAKEAITPIKLVAPFNLSPPTSTPTLPPGLSFSAVDVSSVTISGTPLVTAPQTNYLIIGKEVGTSRIVSSTLPIVISNERIQTNITNSGLVSGMQIDTPITPVTLTTIANGTVRYSWSSLPLGIFATDNSTNVVTSPFVPTDPSKTLILTGTPTINTAIQFLNSGYSNGFTQSILTERFNPLPLITSNLPVTFQFGETVLFDTTTVPTLYKDLAFDPSATYFRAVTYFTSNVGMSNIFSPDLRTDLSLAFNSNDRAYLVGNPKPTTPTTTGTFTIRAVNSNAVTRDISTSITVANDSVTFVSPTPAVDTCYNFVLSRSVDLSLNGYYPYPIEFSANAASGKPIAWTSSGFGGTGLSLSDTSGSSVRIVGTPSNVSALQTLSVTATAFDTSATATRNVKFEVLNDVVTLSDISLNDRIVTQNKAITPIQVIATTLSGRPIRTFLGTNFLPGLSISRTGLISGTPTSNADVTVTATVTADTGFVTGTKNYDFINLADKIVIALANSTETVPTTFSDVYFRVLGYSGTEGTIDVSSASTDRAPWQGSNFTVSTVLGNYLQGDFSTVPALLSRYRFAIGGNVGSTRRTQPVDVTVNNAPTFVRHIVGLESIAGSNAVVKLLRNTGPSVTLTGSYDYNFTGTDLTWSSANVSSSLLSNVLYGVHDLAQSSNVLVAVLGSNIVRSADAGATWSLLSSSNILSLDVSGGVAPSSYTANPLFGCIATDGSSNWLSIANGSDGSTFYNIVRTSSNNGLNWVDTSTNLFVNVNSNTKLYYNNSRYFVLAGSSATNPLLHAESSNVTSWTAPTFASGDIFNDLAFSNNTVLVVGSNASTSACYSSPNNGDTWTALSSSPISYSGSAEINTAGYAYGQWSVAGVSAGGVPAISFSRDISSWTETNAGSGRLTATVEDGSAWLWAGTGGGITGTWDSSGNVGIGYTGWDPSGLPVLGSKRIVATTVSNGTPSLTLTMPYPNATNLSFASPTRTSYLHWQYIPIQPITIEANYTPTNIDEVVYYYVYNLPDGLTFSLDPASSFIARITGTSVTYSDAPQRTVILASDASLSAIVPLVLDMRTILPTVQKQQTGAGAWTSYLRQYTEVNAATTARDSRATPAIEYRLGEFTRPEPPSVITAEDNCKC